MRKPFRTVCATVAALATGLTLLPGAVMADEQLVNVALGKVPTTNATELFATADPTIPRTNISGPSSATDGNTQFTPNGNGEDRDITKVLAGKESGNPSDNNGFGTWNDVYLQYDLGEVRDVSRVKLYHNGYQAATSTFKNVKVEVSETPDFAYATTIGNAGDYRETRETQFAPQTLEASQPVQARYVRIWQKGHYIENLSSAWKGYSNGIGFREIEVYAVAKPGETPAPGDEPRNIALGHMPFVRGLTPTNLSAIADGKIDSNYAVHNSLGNRMLQFEYRNTYEVRKVLLALEPGTYKSIDVSIPASPQSNVGTSIYSRRNVTVTAGDPINIELSNPRQARTIRFTINRADDQPTKYSEVEIWATGKNFDEELPEYTAPASKYDTLVWQDEFDGTTVDETKWNIIDGMVNHSAIYNRGAASIKKDGDNSYLALKSKNYNTSEQLIDAVGVDRYDSSPIKHLVTWSSGRVESKNKFSFQNGRMAVRAKANDSKGIWPAIWMLAQDETGHDEIDVLEHLGQDAWGAWTTNHYGILGSTKGSDGHQAFSPVAWSQEFHVYEVEWDPERITWFIDGQQVFTTTKGKNVDGMHSRPMFPILEVQVGDGWVGPVDYSKQETKQDSDFLIDWVRVYQENDSPKVYFDDLDGKQTNGYRIAPTQRTDGLKAYTDGSKLEENKNNFYYGGQPRYENSRLARTAADGSEQYLTYALDGVKDVHLTTYYQTDPKAPTDPVNAGWRKTIRRNFPNGAIDFSVQTSTDCKADWADATVSVVENYIEDGGYARTTFDAYSLPEGTQCVRVKFPTLSAGTARVNPSDIQLAKVTFTATGEPVSPEPTDPPTETTTAPTVEPTTQPSETAPTSEPTAEPTTEPTSEPTTAPTTKPTTAPTEEPTAEPTTKPTVESTTEQPNPAKIDIADESKVKIEWPRTIEVPTVNAERPVGYADLQANGFKVSVVKAETNGIMRAVTRFFAAPVIPSDAADLLVEGRDYTVKIANPTKAGETTLTVTGVGNYTGEVTRPLTIVVKSEPSTEESSEATEDSSKTNPTQSPNPTDGQQDASDVSVSPTNATTASAPAKTLAKTGVGTGALAISAITLAAAGIVLTRRTRQI